MFTPSGGAPIDVTHTGSVSIKIVEAEIASIELEIAFPMLVAGEPQVVVAASFDALGVGSGSIRRGQEPLAVVSGNRNVMINWIGACAL